MWLYIESLAYPNCKKGKKDACSVVLTERFSNVFWNIWQPISVTDQEILEMILFPIVNEACRILDEGIVVRASDLDIATVLGMSFPSYRLVIYCLLFCVELATQYLSSLCTKILVQGMVISLHFDGQWSSVIIY